MDWSGELLMRSRECYDKNTKWYSSEHMNNSSRQSRHRFFSHFEDKNGDLLTSRSMSILFTVIFLASCIKHGFQIYLNAIHINGDVTVMLQQRDSVLNHRELCGLYWNFLQLLIFIWFGWPILACSDNMTVAFNLYVVTNRTCTWNVWEKDSFCSII